MQCVRRVAYTDGYEEELFVVLRGGIWVLPDALPDRFRDRVLISMSTVTVASLPNKTFRAGLKSFAEGMWASYGDSVIRGGHVPCIFGQPISLHAREALEGLRRTTSMPVVVSYHGTGGDAFKSIAKTRLNPTRGQLGIGCYVGSFWKACRFAARDQSYAWRPHPVVIRVLWRCPVVEFPNSPCGCPECLLKPDEKRRVCAHGVEWSGRAAYLPAVKYSDGTWATRNEEWCVPTSAIVRLAEAVDLDRDSVHGPHYDPLQRDIRFL